jgi:hypothetical protein
MTLERYAITQNYPIKCKGRNEIGEEVLSTPIKVNVKISKESDSNMISSIVKCRYNDGGHGQRCTASGKEKVNCPYSFDIPYALENKKEK